MASRSLRVLMRVSISNSPPTGKPWGDTWHVREVVASGGPETPEGEGGAHRAAELSSVAASLPGGLG